MAQYTFTKPWGGNCCCGWPYYGGVDIPCCPQPIPNVLHLTWTGQNITAASPVPAVIPLTYQANAPFYPFNNAWFSPLYTLTTPTHDLCEGILYTMLVTLLCDGPDVDANGNPFPRWEISVNVQGNGVINNILYEAKLWTLAIGPLETGTSAICSPFLLTADATIQYPPTGIQFFGDACLGLGVHFVPPYGDGIMKVLMVTK